MNDLEQLRATLVDARREFLAGHDAEWTSFTDQQQAALRHYLTDLGLDPSDRGQGLALFAGAELLHRVVRLEPFTFRIPAAHGVLAHLATITTPAGG